jgi:protein-disulfide isomerase
VAPVPGGLGERKLVLGFGLLILALIVAGILLYRGEQAPGAPVAESAALASEHSPTLGDASAKVHVVEFLDPACETCAAFFPIVKQLIADNPGRIRLSIRHLALHEGSDVPVRVLEASRAQGKYWETLQALLGTQSQWAPNHVARPELVMSVLAGVGLDMERLHTDMNSAEVTQRVERDLSDAKSLKVTATPEYFVNGKPMPSFGEQQLRDLVAQALSEAY